MYCKSRVKLIKAMNFKSHKILTTCTVCTVLQKLQNINGRELLQKSQNLAFSILKKLKIRGIVWQKSATIWQGENLQNYFSSVLASRSQQEDRKLYNIHSRRCGGSIFDKFLLPLLSKNSVGTVTISVIYS